MCGYYIWVPLGWNFFLPKVHLYKGVHCAKREDGSNNHIYTPHICPCIKKAHSVVRSPEVCLIVIGNSTTGCPNLNCATSQCSCNKIIGYFDWFLYGQRLAILISMLIGLLKLFGWPYVYVYFWILPPIYPFIGLIWRKMPFIYPKEGFTE